MFIQDDKKYGLTKGNLNRPWMVRFSISLQSEDVIVCSGSLLNRRWIISAAHCFCPLYEVRNISQTLLSLSAILQFSDCSQRERGFTKEFSKEAKAGHGKPGEKLQDRISVTFGTTDETEKYAEDQNLKVETVKVHPDYWQDEMTGGGNNYDLALIMMDKVGNQQGPVLHPLTNVYQDIYEGDSHNDNIQRILIQPICLPPFGPVDPQMIRAAKNDPGSISEFWYKKDMLLVPFEDMDCEVEFSEKIQVPKATDGAVREAQRKLNNQL